MVAKKGRPSGPGKSQFRGNKRSEKAEINPFELRYNKIKHKVLGRKVAKNEVGKPLVSRNRAFQKRKQTLLEEYQNKHKGGKRLQDLRDNSEQERVISKYKQAQKEVKLSESEKITLTHKGKPLDDFIDDRISSDDEDVDLFGTESYVDSAHF